MSEKRKTNKRLEYYVYRQLTQNRNYSSDDRHHILTEEEQDELKKIRISTFWKAGITGGISIVLLYTPYYLYPELFPETKIWLPYFSEYYGVPLVFLAYSLFLVMIEIAVLVYFNIHAVKNIAHACGYPNPNDPHFETDVHALIAVGLERKQKSQEALGINPFEGLSRIEMLLFTTVYMMKAALSNFLFKLLVSRILGRYALRVVIDFAGVPVYAFWNCWAANRVMNETRVRVMAAPIINDLSNQLMEEQKDNPEFINEIYYILDYIAITKRTFHYNHYLLSINMLEKFSISIDPEHEYDPGFLLRIEKGSDRTKRGFSKLILFGMLIDGKLSKKEEYLISKMHKEGYFTFSREQGKRWTEDYFSGRGLEQLVYFN